MNQFHSCFLKLSGRKTISLLALFAVSICADLFAQQPDSTFWVPNGPVHSLLLRDTTIIIGGDFDQVSPVTGSLISLDPVTAEFDPSLFKVNGPVYATTRDSSGYVYVGGNFTFVGNQQIDNLFRLKPNGTFDNTFIHSVSGTVYALQVQDSGLFIGGAFTHIDGEPRNNFGGINLNTGDVNDCNPDVNGPVYCMEVDSFTAFPTMIIGGNFNGVFGYNPPFLAKIFLATGSPFTFNAVPWTAVPNANGPVYDVDLVGSDTLYIGGEFNTFGNTGRKGLAMLLRHAGTLQALNANIQGKVYALEVTDTCIYIGGRFTSVDNQPRNNLAMVNLSFDVQPWNPGANGDVRVIEKIDTTNFFIGGDFSLAGGDTCGRAAIIDVTGAAANWNPLINAGVRTVIWDPTGRMLVGGEFFGAGGTLRNNLCALSTNTGRTTSWNPDVNAAVNTMTFDGDSLYFAGDFGFVGGIARGRMGAIDLLTESLLPFNPGVTGLVRTIVVADSVVYAGGNLTSFGGQLRGNIGCVNKTTGLATPWNPNCLGTVNTILVTRHWIYVLGFYSTISGVNRENISRLNPNSGYADQNWVCSTDEGIYHAEFYNTSLVIVGWFDLVNGQSSPDFAMIDTTSLQLTPVNFNTDGFARTFTRFGDDFFISGMFDLVNTAYQPRLVAYDAGNSGVDTWTPAPDAGPETMQATATHLYIGGSMGITGSRFQPNLQVLTIQWVTPVNEIPLVNSSLHIYPNPAKDIITISNVPGCTEFTICDLSGAIVQRGILNGSMQEISLENLAAGMYVLTVSGAETLPVSQRIIKL